MDNSINNQLTKGVDGQKPVPPAGRPGAGGAGVCPPEDAGGRSLGNRATMPGAAGADASLGDARTMRPGMAGPAGRRFAEGELLLGRYRVKGELGQGGMGVVYRCLDEVAGLIVALKALPPEVAHNSGEMEEVRANFRLVSKLHHPNIANANTLERDAESGDYYLIMECVDGYDVRQWVRRRRDEGRPLTLDEVTIIAYRIAEALDYAHEQGVIHRDIKPSNVRVNFTGEVKVLDFGLAAQLHQSLSRVSQASHGTSGTGPYMAPEQWMGRRQGAAADQYALAATVYELLGGTPPFENHDTAILREAVLKDTPLPMEGVPPHVNATLLRALSKDPAARFASCGEFVKALVEKGVGSRESSAERRQPETGGRRIVLLAVAGVVVMLLVLVVNKVVKPHHDHQAREIAGKDHTNALNEEQQKKVAAQQKRDKAKDEFEAVLKKADLALLDKFGGKIWKKALNEQRIGEGSANDPEAGELAYASALAALREAEKTVLEVDQLCKEAVAAKDKRNWQVAVLAAERMLELCPGQQQAQALKNEAVKCIEQIQEWTKAKDKFDSALAKVDISLLEMNGSNKWEEVKQLRMKGEVSADDLEKGIVAYQTALAWLIEITAEAEAEKRIRVRRAEAAYKTWAEKAGSLVARKDRVDLRDSEAVKVLLSDAAKTIGEAEKIDVANLSANSGEGIKTILSDLNNIEGNMSLREDMLVLETIRRKSLDDHGYASLETARKALRDGDYALARNHYKQALDFIGNRPATLAAREEARVGIGEAYYRDAKLALTRGDFEKALPLASQALERGHPQAGSLVETLRTARKR